MTLQEPERFPMKLPDHTCPDRIYRCGNPPFVAFDKGLFAAPSTQSSTVKIVGPKS